MQAGKWNTACASASSHLFFCSCHKKMLSPPKFSTLSAFCCHSNSMRNPFFFNSMYGNSMGYGGAYGGGYGRGYGMGGYGMGGYGMGGMGMMNPMMMMHMMGRFPMLESAQMIIGGIGAITQMVGTNAQLITHAFSSLSHMITHFGHSGGQLLGLVPLTSHRVGPQGENLGPLSEEEMEMERKHPQVGRWAILIILAPTRCGGICVQRQGRILSNSSSIGNARKSRDGGFVRRRWRQHVQQS